MNNYITQFIKPDLIILIPVLFIVNLSFRKSTIKKCKIPLILGAISIILSGLKVFATSGIANFESVLTAIFVSFCQGILVTGSVTFFNQMKVKSGKYNSKSNVHN